MGACSSGQGHNHREKELTDVLVKYSRLVEPEAFATLVDLLKQQDISGSWISMTKNITSAPRKRRTSKAEQQCITNQNGEHDDSYTSLLEQKQKQDNQDDEIKSLNNEIKTLRMKVQTLEQLLASSIKSEGDHHLHHHKPILEEKGSEDRSTADTRKRLKHHLQPTRPNVSMTGKTAEQLQKHVSDKTQKVSESESIQRQTTDGNKTETEKRAYDQNTLQPYQNLISQVPNFDEERQCLLSKISKLEEMNGKLQSKISSSDKHNQSARRDTEEEATRREREMAHMASQMKELQQENGALKEEFGKKDVQLRTMQTRNDDWKREQKTKEDKQNNLYNDVKTSVAVLQRDNERLKSELRVSEDELRSVRVNKDKLTRERETVGQEHHTSRTDLEGQVVSLKGDSTALSSTVERLQQNVAVLKRQLGAREDELKTERLNKAQLTRELETVGQQHHTTYADLESVRKEYHTTRTDLETERQEHRTTRTDLESVRKDYHTTRTELESVRKEYHTTRTELESVRKEYHTTRTELESVRKEYHTTRTELESVRKEYHTTRTELELVRTENHTTRTDLESVRKEYHTTRTGLEEQVVSFRGVNHELSSAIEKLQQKLGVIEDELKIERGNNDQLTRELETVRQEYHTIRTDLEGQVVSLRGDNTALLSTVEKLQRNVAMMERQLDAEYQQFHMLHREAGEAVDMIHWRDEPIFDKQYLQNLKDEIEHYWPLRVMGVSEDALPHVNILFIGPIGAGKSSFINSVESAFRGHVTVTAGAGSRDRSVTSMYRQYPILASDNRHTMKFQLCDCRGLEDSVGISRDIDSMLEGHIPDNYVFNTSFPLKRNMHGYKHRPRLEDKVHCVVYVLDAETYSAELGIPFVTDPVREEIKAIQETVDQKGVPQLVILSKVDNVCESTKHNTSMVYRSHVLRQRCIDAAGCLGLPPMKVLAMKNYFMETSTTDDISILALYNIRQMLRAADDFLRVNHLDELREDKQIKV